MLDKDCIYNRDNVNISFHYHHDAAMVLKEQEAKRRESGAGQPISEFVLDIDKDGWATVFDGSWIVHTFFIPDDMFKRLSRHGNVDFEDDVQDMYMFVALRNERLELDKVIVSLRDIEI